MHKGRVSEQKPTVFHHTWCERGDHFSGDRRRLKLENQTCGYRRNIWPVSTSSGAKTQTVMTRGCFHWLLASTGLVQVMLQRKAAVSPFLGGREKSAGAD
ncbi:conserved membrane hypothetical protein [Anopheles sinensis]|uniref:Uncharacterized protein n=1 Tax=Anopheles sinensis TaxID=74873 RepID=A0A084VBL7_ANOSI|nr:conserved membrane hypothetical protein [Anopheles sinensis]